jgi:hypothetical protein
LGKRVFNNVLFPVCLGPHKKQDSLVLELSSNWRLNITI